MEAITKNRWENRWDSYSYKEPSSNGNGGIPLPLNFYFIKDKLPFAVVNDYYLWVQHEMDKKYPNQTYPNQPGNSRWAVGASYLVSELEKQYIDIRVGNIPAYTVIFEDIRPVLKDLNIGIANFAVKKFNDALFGNDVGKVKWYEWDRDFIRNEQVTNVAWNVYNYYFTNAKGKLDDMDDIVRHEGILGPVVAQVAKLDGKPIPNFSLFGNCHINEKDDSGNLSSWIAGFGEAGRYHIPLLMLYKEFHLQGDNITTLINKANVDAYQLRPVPSYFPSCTQYPSIEAQNQVETSNYKILQHYQKMKY